MANKDYNKEDGVWRTIGGRRVFIKNGQSLADAMKESGKFSRVQKNQDLYKKLDDEKKDGVELNEKQKEAGERLNKKAENGVLNDIKDYLSGRENYEGTQDEFINDLSREWGVDKDRVEDLLHDEMVKHPRNFKDNSDKKESMSREDYDKLYDKKVYDEGMSESQFKKEYGERPQESMDETNRKIADHLANVSKVAKEMGDEKGARTNELASNYAKSQIGENNFKNNWQDEIKTFDQLVEKEKEVKEQYENYKKEAEKHKDSWNPTQIQKNEESYKKTLQNIDDWKKELAQKEIKEGTSVDNGFTQQVDFGGTTRLYNKNELKRMEDAGIRPMEHSYTGGGWEGVNSDKHMDTKDQAKAIIDAIKKKYPDVKVARKSNLFSGGSSIDFNIMSSDKDLFVSDSDIDKMGYEDLHDVSRSNGFEWWAKDNVPNYNENHSYNIDDVRKYAKQSLAQRKTTDIQGVKGNEWYLNDYGKKVVSDLNKEANSYTYSDSDGMIDYFDHGTYMHISIGKWNKPYQVTGNSVTSLIKNKAYQKYLKEHPSSKMTLEEFKKNQKK